MQSQLPITGQQHSLHISVITKFSPVELGYTITGLVFQFSGSKLTVTLCQQMGGIAGYDNTAVRQCCQLRIWIDSHYTMHKRKHQQVLFLTGCNIEEDRHRHYNRMHAQHRLLRHIISKLSQSIDSIACVGSSVGN